MQKEKPLKDLVLKGAFLVVLIYLLVFLYNSGLLSKIRKQPAPELPVKSETFIDEPKVDLESYYESSESYELPAEGE